MNGTTNLDDFHDHALPTCQEKCNALAAYALAGIDGQVSRMRLVGRTQYILGDICVRRERAGFGHDINVTDAPSPRVRKNMWKYEAVKKLWKEKNLQEVKLSLICLSYTIIPIQRGQHLAFDLQIASAS